MHSTEGVSPAWTQIQAMPASVGVLAAFGCFIAGHPGLWPFPRMDSNKKEVTTSTSPQPTKGVPKKDTNIAQVGIRVLPSKVGGV